MGLAKRSGAQDGAGGSQPRYRGAPRRQYRGANDNSPRRPNPRKTLAPRRYVTIPKWAPILKRAASRVSLYSNLWDIGYNVGFIGASIYNKYFRNTNDVATMPFVVTPFVAPIYSIDGADAFSYDAGLDRRDLPRAFGYQSLGGPTDVTTWHYALQVPTSGFSLVEGEIVVPAYRGLIFIGPEVIAPPFPRYNTAYVWGFWGGKTSVVHVQPARNPTTIPIETPWPTTAPEFMPGIKSIPSPVYRPSPALPRPTEWPVADPAPQPGVRPSPQPRVEPDRPRRDQPRTRPRPRPGRPPRPRFPPDPSRPPIREPNPETGLPPYVVPSTDFHVGPGTGVRPRPVQSTHTRKPAPPGTKEKRKIRWDARNAAGGLYGAATEVKDVADAIAKSMPSDYQKAYRQTPGLHNKLAFLLRNWRKIDAANAILNVAEDQLKDYVIGKSNSMASKAITKSPYWRSPRGPGIARGGGIGAQ